MVTARDPAAQLQHALLTRLKLRQLALLQAVDRHRTLARVVAPGVAKRDGGPIEKVTGIQGVAESVDPPNNNGYERTLKWTKISQAVAALTPFADPAAARKAGFDTGKPYRFKPFTPRLPQPLGEFHSFAG